MRVKQVPISKELAEGFNRGVETHLKDVIRFHKQHDNVEVVDALQLVRHI